MSIVYGIESQTPKYVSIRELFIKDVFKIPEYQRRYAWKKIQIDEFVESMDELILEAEQSNSLSVSNYLGGILVSKDHAKDYKNEYMVMDGQQRLTTFLVTLCVFRDLLQQELTSNYIELVGKVETIQAKIFEIENLLIKSSMNDYGESEKRNRLIQDKNSDGTVFNEILAADNRPSKFSKGSPLLIKAYISIANFIRETITDSRFYNEDNNNVLPVFRILKIYDLFVNQTYVLRTEVSTEVNAFALFESVNTTGLPLSAFDLINGFIISKITEAGLTDLKQTWQSDIESYRQNEARLDDYIFHWFVAKDKKTSRVNMHRELKTIVNKNPSSLKEIVEELLLVFKLFDEYVNGNSTSAILIKTINRKGLLPIFLSMSLKEYNQDLIEKNMIDVIKYSMLELNFLNKSPGTFQYKIQSVVEHINSTKEQLDFGNIVKGVSSIKNDYSLYDITLYDSIINGEIDDSSFYKGIFFLLIGKNQTSVNVYHNKIHLEHIYPQKPHSDWSEIAEWKELQDDSDKNNRYTSMVGNLMLLDSKLNISISNSIISKKASKYKESIHSNDVLRNSKWNKVDYDNFSPEYIITRTKNITQILMDEDLFNISKFKNVE